LADMNIELRNLEYGDFSAYEPANAQPNADDGAVKWLYDSGREYLDQIKAYKSYGRDGGTPDGGREAA
jgi:hypothetical protein